MRTLTSLPVFLRVSRERLHRRPVWRDCAHHQEVRTNRRDFLGSEITRHFRSLCAENRSLRLVWHVQATFLGVVLPKSLAANFGFQSCIAPRVGAARSQVATRGNHRREESPSLAGLTTRKRG